MDRAPPTPLTSRLAELLDNLGGDTDLAALDALSAEFFSTTAMSREQKIALLLARILRDPKTFGAAEQYCFDMLSALQPIELADQLLSAYPVLDTVEARSALLQTLKATCISHVPPEDTDPARLAALKANVPGIEQFLVDVLYSGDQAVLADALSAYCAIVQPDDSAQMAVSIINEWLMLRHEGTLTSEDISPINLLQQVVQSGIATAATQDRVLTLLPTLLNTFPSQEIAVFHEYLYRVLGNADLTDPALDALSAYLLSREPSPSASSTFYHWANSVTRVTGGMDPVKRVGMLAHMLRDESEPLNRASLIVYGPIEMFDSMPRPEINDVRESLDRYRQSVSGEEAEIAQTAVETIDEYFSGTAQRTPHLESPATL